MFKCWNIVKHGERHSFLEDVHAIEVWVGMWCLKVTAGHSGCRLLCKGAVLTSLLHRCLFAPSCYNSCWSGYPEDQSWEPIALFISSGLNFSYHFLVQPLHSYCFLHRDPSSNKQLGHSGAHFFTACLIQIVLAQLGDSTSKAFCMKWSQTRKELEG